MSKHGRSAFLVALVSTVLPVGRDARAAGCSPSTAESTCFDADAMASPYAPSDFFTLSRARAMDARSWAVGLDLTVLHGPVTLHAPSPDPRGRDVGVVRDLLDGTLAVAGSPVRHLELGAALPFSLYRTGTGTSGVTSQTGADLSHSALRDVRLGAGYDVFRARPSDGVTTVSGLVRLDVSLPTGQHGSFAGQRSPVAEPAFDVDVKSGSFFAAAEERLRLREPVTFGGELLGAQWLTALGVGWDALERERLRVTLEAFVAPYLGAHARVLADGTRLDSAVIVPSEWMLSVRTRLDAVLLGVGGGTGIPLSSDRRTDASGTHSENFAAPTTPEFRAALTLRYVFSPSASDMKR